MLNNLAESTSPLLKIVPDFQVNPNNDDYSNFDEPSITYLADGGFVIVYNKYRSTDIYGQRYNSDGTTQGQAFLINTNTESNDSSLQIATLKNGDFVVTWVSEKAIYQSYILGQRFKTDGTKIGSEFRVSTQNKSRDQLIVSLSNGGFVVIWVNQDSANPIYNIYGQRYDADGAKVGQAFQINTNTDISPTLKSVAALADGGFLFTWQEQSSGLYGQRYDANGVKVGQAFQIGDNSDDSSSFVTSLADGRYLITWLNESDSSSVYYGQLYNLDGSLSGDTFVFNLDIPVTESNNYISSITALPNGGFLIAYNDRYTQEYDANANRVGQAVQISSGQQGYQDSLSVTSLTNGGYAAVWDSGNINAAIFGAGDAGSIAFSQTSYSVGEDGTPVTVITLIRTGGSDSDVSVTLTPSDGTATVSDDYNNSPIVVSFNIGETSKTVTITLVNDNFIEADETINLTLSNPTGNVTLGSETNATLTIIDNDNNNLPKKPSLRAGTELLFSSNSNDHVFSDVSVASLANGGFVVTGRSDTKIFSQRYDANENPIGQSLQIDTLGDGYAAKVASLTDNGFVVTWVFNANIYGQRYDANGSPIGSQFLVNTLTQGNQPAITSLNDGGFVVTWLSTNIYGQRYDANGSPIGSQFLVNTVTERYQYNPAITSLNDGGFVITWWSKSLDVNEVDIYGQRYDANGNPIGSELRVNPRTYNVQSNPAITSLSDGGFVITWVSDANIYGQRYDANNNPIGSEFRINTFTVGYYLETSITSLDTGGFVVTWRNLNTFAAHGNVSGRGYFSGQQFDAQANRVGSEFLIDTLTPDGGYLISLRSGSSVASLTNGGFVAASTGFNSFNIVSQVYRPVDAYGVFSLDQLARSGFVNGLSYTPVEVNGLPLASLYDETYYLSHNPDVAAGVSSGVFSNGYTHFVNFGQFEGRDPSILYDETFYLQHNPDVIDAVENGSLSSGFQHYALYGQLEGRSPSSVFNEVAYRVANPDVNDAIANGGLHSGFEHYLKTNQSEVRNPLNYLYKEVDYLTLYPDVANAVTLGQFQDGFQHYITFGQTEHRNPSRLFNENEYLALNPDVANVVNGGLLTSGFEHYILFGRDEGRAV